MKTLLACSLAVVYGLLMRFIFGFYSGITEIMSISMLVLTPLGFGFLTVYLDDAKHVKSAANAFFMPWVTALVLLCVTIACAIEGAICWIMIYPVFAVVAGLGGLLARFILLEREKAKKQTEDSEPSDAVDDENTPGVLKSSLLLLLPLLTGVVERDRLLAPAEYTVVRQITLEAPAARVWDIATRAGEVAPAGQPGFLSWLFNFPRHLRTEVDTVAVGGHRTAYYERGLFFEETIVQYKAEERMVVAIKADPGNIPPTVLDEHIVVGGRHFKALEDTYTLRTLPDGRCQLQLSGRININTPFNWYAGLWAKWVLGEVLEGALERVKKEVN